MIPTAEEVRHRLRYCPDTGTFWRRKTGKVVGHPRHKGYIFITIRRKEFRAHRIAWLYVTGEWPSHFVDHRNGDKADNRFSNLRIATNAQNIANSKTRARHGFKGAWKTPSGRWKAEIRSNGRKTCLGSYDTPEEASAAYYAKAKEIFGEFANCGRGRT